MSFTDFFFRRHRAGQVHLRASRHAARRRASNRGTRHCWGLEQLEDRQLLTANVQMIDVNTNGFGSSPHDFSEINDTLLFVAAGRLYTTDGTPAGTVELYSDMSFPSVFSNLVQIDGSLFFAGHANGQAELWKTDGTIAGTVMVKDINPNTSPDGATAYSSYPSYLTNVNGTLFFRANDGSHGTELWTSDGTEEGTLLVKDIRPGVAPDGSFTYSSYPTNLTSVGGRLFFTADDGANGLELWTSDGTEAGTVLVKDIRPGASEDGTVIYGSNPSALTDLGGTLFFAADDGTGGAELWRSNGTPDGTVRVKDINPDAGASNPSSLINLDGTLFFSAYDAINGAELWRSDGTEAGTRLVREINPGTVGSSPANMLNFNGTLVFSADDGVNGAELWRSDGTEAGTFMIHDINAGATGSFPTSFLGAEGRFYFQADDGPAHGIELWSSDGTSAGTKLAGDFWLGPVSSAPTPLYEKNGIVYVRADVDPYGVELWKTDGTQAGTKLVKDLAPGNWGTAFGIFDFGAPVNFKGELYFSADTGPGRFDHELWKTDGTQAGTVVVKNINPADRNRGDAIDLGSRPGWPTILNDTLFFFANDTVHGHELWKTDGTEAGTLLVKDINPGPDLSKVTFGRGSLVNLNGQLFFGADDGVHGKELWRSDGTEEGTVMIKDINPNGSSLIREVTRVNDRIFFTADDGSNGFELWSSDGSEAGTVLVSDINPGTTSGPDGDVPNSSDPAWLLDIDGTLLFIADDGISGRELWKSDGTEAGTVLVADINPGIASGYAVPFTNVNGTVFFRADDGANGIELWSTDGTTSGTAMVADINPGPASSFSPRNTLNFVNFDGELYFSADDGTHGVELWRSDGTTEGTVLVADINPGPANSILIGRFPFGAPSLVVVGGELYFGADDGLHGSELWRSDGTAAGTELVADIIEGPASSEPASIGSLSNAVFFTAPADGFRELFKIDLVDRLPGDADGDGEVAFADFQILANNFGKAGQFTFADGDFDGNGRVDFRDFLILSNNFGQGREATPAAPTSTQLSPPAIDLAFAEIEELLIDDALSVFSTT